MGRTFLRQAAQVRESQVYDDTKSAGSTLESGQTHIEDDLNALRSQFKRAIWADESGNWYDDITTHNSKKRAIDKLNEDLDDVEEHRFLFRTQVLTDISVPADAAATGTLTFGSNPSATQTVTIDTKTYTFQATLTDVDGNVHIGATASDSLDNLIAAINLGAGSGTAYAASMTLHPTVSAAAGAGDTMDATCILGGTQGNLIATTDTVTGNPNWGAVTLTGGTGNSVVLSVAGSEAPSLTAAIGAVTTEGAVVAYSASFPNHTMTEVAGPSAIRPDNLCIVRQQQSGDPILSGGKQVYALIQCEDNTDGHTFDDDDERVMLAFIIENSTGDDLIICPAADIAGEDINYSYVQRLKFDSLPESAFLQGVFVDQAAAVDVTLDNAIDNQSGAATQVQDIDVDITDTKAWAFRDSASADLLKIYGNAGGSTSEVEIGADVDIYDNNAADVDFSSGAAFGSAGTEIAINETAGVVERAADLILRASGSGELYLDDANQPGSWAQTDGIKLSETETEWSDFETEFGGEVSLLNAIVQASNAAARTKGSATLQADVAADTDVDATTSSNLDVDLPDYSGVTFLTDVDVFLNGVLLRNGADAAANHDVYPGTTPAQGMLKFEFALEGTSDPDQLTMIVNGD